MKVQKINSIVKTNELDRLVTYLIFMAEWKMEIQCWKKAVPFPQTM